MKYYRYHAKMLKVPTSGELTICSINLYICNEILRRRFRYFDYTIAMIFKMYKTLKLHFKAQ
jgi:hypothetical protein